MNENLRVRIEELRQLNRAIVHELAIADDYVSKINFLLHDLVRTGEVEPIMLLGDPIFDTRTRARTPLIESGRVLQAAMGVGYGGVGVALWDAEKHKQVMRQRARAAHDNGVNFTPFDECPIEVKHLLLPYIRPLVDRFCELSLSR